MESHLQLLNDLVSVAEDLLFTHHLQDFQISRYEEQRNKIYSQLPLRPKNNIKKLIRTSQSKTLTDKKEASSQINLFTDLEKLSQLQRTESENWVEGIRWETVQRIQKSEQICKEYRGFIMVLFGFIDGVAAGVAELAGVKNDCKGVPEVTESKSFEDLGKEYDEFISDIKMKQMQEVAHLNECKKFFRSVENHFFSYFEAIRSMVKAKELQIGRLESAVHDQREKFEEESNMKSEKIKEFEIALKKSKESSKEKFRKMVQKVTQESQKKEEAILRQKNEEIQEILKDKEKIIQKLQKAIEEFEKTNEKQSAFIGQLKAENQEIQVERQTLLKQIEKSSSIVEELKNSLDEKENDLKYLHEQTAAIKDQNKELKNRMGYMEQEFEESFKVIEGKYIQMLEQVKNDGKENIEDLKLNISALEEEVTVKNQEIGELYMKFQDIQTNKYHVHDLASEKEIEYQELLKKFKEIVAENKNLKENSQKVWKKMDEIQIRAEKCYLMVKKMPKNVIDDYFSELLTVAVELYNDKEWLLRKLEDVAKTHYKTDQVLKVPYEVSRAEYGSEFINTSVKSFQALKSFEKTRSDIFHNIKGKNY